MYTLCPCRGFSFSCPTFIRMPCSSTSPHRCLSPCWKAYQGPGYISFSTSSLNMCASGQCTCWRQNARRWLWRWWSHCASSSRCFCPSTTSKTRSQLPTGSALHSCSQEHCCSPECCHRRRQLQSRVWKRSRTPLCLQCSSRCAGCGFAVSCDGDIQARTLVSVTRHDYSAFHRSLVACTRIMIIMML